MMREGALRPAFTSGDHCLHLVGGACGMSVARKAPVMWAVRTVLASGCLVRWIARASNDRVDACVASATRLALAAVAKGIIGHRALFCACPV
jgi:hypothetical protein